MTKIVENQIELSKRGRFSAYKWPGKAGRGAAARTHLPILEPLNILLLHQPTWMLLVSPDGSLTRCLPHQDDNKM